MRVTCTLCQKVLKHACNTTNLMQHLQRKHIFHLQYDDLPENHDTSICVDNNLKETQRSKTMTKIKDINKNKIIYEENEDEIDNASC